jgi:hypothetical protein
MNTMSLHAEEFATPLEARRRYLELSLLLRSQPDSEVGCYNVLYEGTRPVVAVIAPEAPAGDLPGHKGRPISLPGAFWQALALRHDRGRAEGPHERHHTGGMVMGPDGGDVGSRN